MQKIVFVLGNYKNGGMAMRATNLANEFGKQGYSVEIAVLKELGNDFFTVIDKNVQVISVNDYNADDMRQKYADDCKKRNRKIKALKRLHYLTKNFSKIDRKLSGVIMFLRKGDELRNYFLFSKPDVVVSLGKSYIESVVSALQGSKCKIIYAEKNPPELEFPERDSEGYNYYIKLFKKLKAVVVQTKDAERFFEGRLNNLYVINNPIRQNLPLPSAQSRTKTIVNFCRMSSQKNLDLLIDSFVKIHLEFPEYKLYIYGNTVDQLEVDYKERMLQKVKTLKLEDCIYILPAVADIHKRVINCAMFVSSSDFEGLSNSMLEAMAIGLPCICTDCLGGGTREVMKDRENGLVVPMNDVEALYKAMKCFIMNPDFAETCGRNAAKLRESMSVEKIAREWLKVFDI